MDMTTANLSKYIKDKGISISVISKSTGVSYGKLDSSLKVGGTRGLRADEYLTICRFIEKEPLEFYTSDMQLQQTGT